MTFYYHDDESITIQDGCYILNRYNDIDDLVRDYNLSENQKDELIKDGYLCRSEL